MLCCFLREKHAEKSMNSSYNSERSELFDPNQEFFKMSFPSEIYT